MGGLTHLFSFTDISKHNLFFSVLYILKSFIILFYYILWCVYVCMPVCVRACCAE